jgi:predicted alpha/beta hydrolase family esterase
MATNVLFVQGAGAGAYACDRELARSLQRELGGTYRVCYPRMPDEATPRYPAWKAALLEAFAALDDGCVLVGHSVGGAVLVHVLAEERLDWAPGVLGLIAPPFIGPGGWTSDDIGPFPGAACLPVGLPVFLQHGTHDEAVPPAHARLYARAMHQATVRMLPCRDHQLDNDLSELARDIASLDLAARK